MVYEEQKAWNAGYIEKETAKRNCIFVFVLVTILSTSCLLITLITYNMVGIELSQTQSGVQTLDSYYTCEAWNMAAMAHIAAHMFIDLFPVCTHVNASSLIHSPHVLPHIGALCSTHVKLIYFLFLHMQMPADWYEFISQVVSSHFYSALPLVNIL